jgi:hypothetical protein
LHHHEVKGKNDGGDEVDDLILSNSATFWNSAMQQFKEKVDEPTIMKKNVGAHRAKIHDP